MKETVWHDLRKDYEDWPEETGRYVVVTEHVNAYEDIVQDFHVDKYVKDNLYSDFNYYTRDKFNVIAWCKLEDFEG